MTRVFTLTPALALAVFSLAGPVAACTLCHSDPAQAVRAGLLAAGPIRSAAATGLPVLMLAVAVFGFSRDRRG